ncbi:hypothetical protein ACR9GP_25250 [Enterobacter ludwigii]
MGTHVETSLLNNIQGYHSPTEGSAASFMHSNGTNLCIKGHPFETDKTAKRIMTLKGYSIRNKEPIILSACYAENGGEPSMVQHFSNGLQRVVIASSGLVHIKTSDDKMILTSIYSDQPFETFRPLPSYFSF